LMSPRWGLRSVQTAWWRGAGVLQAASDGRRRQAEIAARWIANYRNVIVAGDFNTPPESPVFRDNFGTLSSAFTVAGWGVGSTYFAGRFSLRLDHILCNDQWQPKGCWVGPDVGSEHRPLTAVLARTREDN
jgi:vancomycin resistance protein VanJ